jgi:molecular chaperone HscB
MKILDFSQSYFDLFEQPLRFEIDLKQMHENQQNLQTKFHPDRFVNASAEEKRLSVQQASWVNEAYQTLVNPVKRAHYMLEVSGQDMKNESETTSDVAFLMEQIALREQMEEVRDKQEPLEECDILVKHLKLRSKEMSDDFTSSFELGDFETAKLVSRKMQFVQRLSDQVMDLQFQLEDENS